MKLAVHTGCSDKTGGVLAFTTLAQKFLTGKGQGYLISIS